MKFKGIEKLVPKTDITARDLKAGATFIYIDDADTGIYYKTDNAIINLEVGETFTDCPTYAEVFFDSPVKEIKTTLVIEGWA